MQIVDSMEIYVRCYERKQKNPNNAQIKCFDSFEDSLFSLDVELKTDIYSALLDDKKQHDLVAEARTKVEKFVMSDPRFQMRNEVRFKIHYCENAHDFFATKRKRYRERNGGAGAAHGLADPDLQNKSTIHKPRDPMDKRTDPMEFHNPAYNPYFVSF